MEGERGREDQRKSREERGSGYIVGDSLSPANKPNSIWKIKMNFFKKEKKIVGPGRTGCTQLDTHDPPGLYNSEPMWQPGLGGVYGECSCLKRFFIFFENYILLHIIFRRKYIYMLNKITLCILLRIILDGPKFLSKVFYQHINKIIFIH